MPVPSPSERALTDFDLNDRTIGEGQPRVLESLLKECPVGFSTRYGGYWHIASYNDCVAAARDHRRFTTSQGVLIPPSGKSVRIVPAELDPPEHTKHRKLLMTYFSPGAVEASEPFIADVVRRVLGHVVHKGTADLAAEFAVQVPPLVITGLLGIEPEHCEEMRRLGERYLETQIADDVDARRAAAIELEQWVQDRISSRRGSEIDDVLARIVHAEIDGQPLNDETVLGIVRVLIMAGHETTIHSIASMLYRVAATPGVRERLLDDRSLVPRVVNESLRLDSPVLYLGRTVTEDTVLGDQRLIKGEPLALLYAAANRDPERFADPHTFDIERDARSHVAFGSGRHRCLGEHLAVLEMRVALNAVLDTIPDYHIDPDRQVTWSSGGVSCGVDSLPVIFTPATAI